MRGFETFAAFLLAALRGESLVCEAQDMRRRMAYNVRRARREHARLIAAFEVNPALLACLVRLWHDETRRTLAYAPVRLATVRDIVRYAVALRRWARYQAERAQYLPCGQDDFVLEGVSQARRDAADLMAYARVQRARGAL